MKDKPKTPYQRLLEEIQTWAMKVAHRHEKLMWRYPKEKIRDSWRLDDLYERVAAADQIGYDVQLVANADGLAVIYKKRVPDVPYKWR
jgi:hypothetical protein